MGPHVKREGNAAFQAANADANWCYENFVNSRTMKSAESVREQLLRIMERYQLPVRGFPVTAADARKHALTWDRDACACAVADGVDAVPVARVLPQHPARHRCRLLHAGALRAVADEGWNPHADRAVVFASPRWHTWNVLGTT